MYLIVFNNFKFKFDCYRFPFYNELKLLMLYMTYPTSDSSLTYVYTNILNPFLKRHEKVNIFSVIIHPTLCRLFFLCAFQYLIQRI